MPSLEFIKLQGAGNDFIFIDARGLSRSGLTVAAAAHMCHRHFGIGADGILWWYEGDSPNPALRIYNADGSVPEMCGNGLRCFVKALRDHHGFSSSSLTVQTDAGEKRCTVRELDGTTHVTVEMGGVHDLRTAGALVPGVRPEILEVCGEPLEVFPLSTGNPHAVVPGDWDDERRSRLGPALSSHSFFPRGANAGFLNVPPSGDLRLSVHERGAGFTLACGTGAVAAAAVAVARGSRAAGERLGLEMPGGTLFVTISEGFAHSLLEGPAGEVFSGVIDLPEMS